MIEYLRKLKQAEKYIREIITEKPEVGVVLGSGLGSLADDIKDAIEIKYEDIPNFPVSTVENHDGKLIFGTLENKKVLVMKGRFHYYEGYDLNMSVFGIRIMKMLGINDVIITNAAGGINLKFKEGTLMLIRDHIGLLAPSTLRGENLDEFGTRFPDMTYAYNREHLSTAITTARKLGIHIEQGVYAFYRGPNFETPAEIKALRILGADAVGMSTVPEVIAANHAGMNVIGISCITNMAAGITEKRLRHDDVIETTNRVKSDFVRYIKGIIGELTCTV
ncbi:MAG: purine-nucleoside phosphorylase [Clostridia bacterium]|nr:purine-nucleoside phosphorylase [Clostridia bacterium]